MKCWKITYIVLNNRLPYYNFICTDSTIFFAFKIKFSSKRGFQELSEPNLDRRLTSCNYLLLLVTSRFSVLDSGELLLKIYDQITSLHKKNNSEHSSINLLNLKSENFA